MTQLIRPCYNADSETYLCHISISLFLLISIYQCCQSTYYVYISNNRQIDHRSIRQYLMISKSCKIRTSGSATKVPGNTNRSMEIRSLPFQCGSSGGRNCPSSASSRLNRRLHIDSIARRTKIVSEGTLYSLHRRCVYPFSFLQKYLTLIYLTLS